MRALLVALALFCTGCAVKGYDLGWRSDGPLTGLLGSPRDALSGCRVGPGVSPAPVCADFGGEVGRQLAALPPVADAPVSLGFRCRAGRCTYANVWERRDVGAATLIPVYRRVPLREVRIAAVRDENGRWALENLVVRDLNAPEYGPVRIGASPARN